MVPATKTSLAPSLSVSSETASRIDTMEDGMPAYRRSAKVRMVWVPSGHYVVLSDGRPLFLHPLEMRCLAAAAGAAATLPPTLRATVGALETHTQVCASAGGMAVLAIIAIFGMRLVAISPPQLSSPSP